MTTETQATSEAPTQEQPITQIPTGAPAPEEQKAQPETATKEAPKPDENKDAKQEVAAVKYEPTGDAGLDYALAYVGELGMGPDHPAVIAAGQGQFDLLEVELAKADAKGAAGVINLAKKAYESFVAKDQASKAELAERIYGIAGGEEQWKNVASWAQQNATEEERTVINSLLEQGGAATALAANYLTTMYRAATGTAYVGKEAAAPDAAAAPAKETGPVSRIELAAKAQELYKKYGDSYVNSSEYQSFLRRLG